MEKEVIASYKLSCNGANEIPLSKKQLKSSSNYLDLQDQEISVTVYKDGEREVGCSYLQSSGRCVDEKKCIHLKPKSSEPQILFED
jgi:hypothetical protein